MLQLIAFLKKGARTFEEICDALDLAPRKAKELILEARAAGYAVDVTGETVGIRPSLPRDEIADIPMEIAKPGEWQKFAQASDLHFGSKYHLRAQFLDFIDRAYDSGVRVILLDGDLLDGCYAHGRWELTHHGFQDQVGDFAENLPQRPGLSYVGITGNHDQTFEDWSGMVAHQAIESEFRARGRRDLTMLGARGAYLRLRSPGQKRGFVIHLWHPRGSAAYALSYKLQKKIEGYPVGAKPDALFCGHYHQMVYFETRGVHAFNAGTFQGNGSSFSKSLTGHTAIGGWIVEYAMTDGGTVRAVRTEWVGYYEKETVREFEMG